MEESIFLSSSETVATFERKYLIEAKVGEGTFGEIFKAREKNQSGTPLQQVAIKSFKGGQGISFTTCREFSVRPSVHAPPSPRPCPSLLP